VAVTACATAAAVCGSASLTVILPQARAR
jgi:hypothetical protein